MTWKGKGYLKVLTTRDTDTARLELDEHRGGCTSRSQLGKEHFFDEGKYEGEYGGGEKEAKEQLEDGERGGERFINTKSLCLRNPSCQINEMVVCAGRYHQLILRYEPPQPTARNRLLLPVAPFGLIHRSKAIHFLP